MEPAQPTVSARLTAPYQRIVFPDVELAEWCNHYKVANGPLKRMNTLQVSPELDLFFLAVDNVVQVRRLSGPSSPPSRPIAILLRDQADAVVLNQIRTGHINGRSALMTVDDGGHVNIFWIEAIRQGNYAPAVSFLNEEATWGLAMCPTRPLVAVSANNWRASIWDLERSVLRRGRVILHGHSHNIPCIDFDPSGHLLASISIDRTVRVWDIERAEMLAQRRIDIHWGWSCRWIRVWDVFTTRVPPPAATAAPATATAKPVANALPVVIAPAEGGNNADEDEEEELEVDSDSDEERLPLLLPDAKPSSVPPKHKRKQGDEETDAEREEREAEERAKRWNNALVLCTDRDFVYLFDASLNALARCRFLPNDIHLGGPHRLSLTEWIASLSVLVVASQGFRARLIHVQRNHAGTYVLIPGDYLPPLNVPTPQVMLMGMSVRELKSDISPSLDAWIVHLIYQDGTLFCYELRHPNELDSLDATAADV